MTLLVSAVAVLPVCVFIRAQGGKSWRSWVATHRPAPRCIARHGTCRSSPGRVCWSSAATMPRQGGQINQGHQRTGRHMFSARPWRVCLPSMPRRAAHSAAKEWHSESHRTELSERPPMTGRLVREAVVVQQLASGVSVGYPLKNSYFRPRAVDMGVGDGCWPMRPPGAVITRTGMNTCGKQLLCRNCARLAPLLPPPRLPRRLQ